MHNDIPAPYQKDDASKRLFSQNSGTKAALEIDMDMDIHEYTIIISKLEY